MAARHLAWRMRCLCKKSSGTWLVGGGLVKLSVLHGMFVDLSAVR